MTTLMFRMLIGEIGCRVRGNSTTSATFHKSDFFFNLKKQIIPISPSHRFSMMFYIYFIPSPSIFIFLSYNENILSLNYSPGIKVRKLTLKLCSSKTVITNILVYKRKNNFLASDSIQAHMLNSVVRFEAYRAVINILQNVPQLAIVA